MTEKMVSLGRDAGFQEARLIILREMKVILREADDTSKSPEWIINSFFKMISTLDRNEYLKQNSGI